MENIIVYLETGCGKTHIAVMLIYEINSRIKKPNKDICIFLAPTVALVEQVSPFFLFILCTSTYFDIFFVCFFKSWIISF